MAKSISSKQRFDKYVEDAADKLIVVDFHAKWCGPCKSIAPKLEKLAKDMKSEVLVLKVDVDKCETLADQFKVRSMPTFAFIKDHELIKKFSGADFEKVKNTVNRLKG